MRELNRAISNRVSALSMLAPLASGFFIMIGIYKIENNINGKVYIGQSVDVDKRFKAHKTLLRNNEHFNYRLQDDWNSYGEDAFSFSIIEKCRSLYLNETERSLIKEYDSTDESKGYNIMAGCGRDLVLRKQSGQKANPDNARSFFRNDVGEIEYNSQCTACDRDCKQSFRADILICPNC